MRDTLFTMERRQEWSEAAGALIADARLRAGLTQAELAARAGTAQSAIAAYEGGQRQPTLPTLYRILAAAGFDLRARLQVADPHDDTLRAWEASLPQAEQERWRAKLAAQRSNAAAWSGR
jgi:transcriptional regulator with XRE-family HTH domain